MGQSQGTAGMTSRVKTVEWNEVTEVGTYLTEQGSLVRFEENGNKGRNSPSVTVVSRLNTTLTRISGDPGISLEGARSICFALNLPVNF